MGSNASFVIQASNLSLLVHHLAATAKKAKKPAIIVGSRVEVKEEGDNEVKGKVVEIRGGGYYFVQLENGDCSRIRGKDNLKLLD